MVLPHPMTCSSSPLLGLEVAEGVDEHVVGLVQPVELSKRRLGERGVPLWRGDERRHVVRSELHGEPLPRSALRPARGSVTHPAGGGRVSRRSTWTSSGGRRRRPWRRTSQGVGADGSPMDLVSRGARVRCLRRRGGVGWRGRARACGGEGVGQQWGAPNRDPDREGERERSGGHRRGGGDG